MKKLVLLVVAMVFFGGCQEIDDLTKAKAEYKCENRGGVYEIKTHQVRQADILITCNDGSIYSYTDEYFKRIRGKGVLKHMNKEATVTVPQYKTKEK